MFTGIIESLGIIKNIEKEGTNLHLTLESELSPELKIDQSISHNGICLTVVKIEETQYTVTAIDETLQKTNLNTLQINDSVNLERCMRLGDRLDGHMVQGHVDQTAQLINLKEKDGSFILTFHYQNQYNYSTVEKGSICLNGISLTVFDSKEEEFSVAIIPYTWEHTNLHQLKKGDAVNIEFDILGKYISNYLNKIHA